MGGLTGESVSVAFSSFAMYSGGSKCVYIHFLITNDQYTSASTLKRKIKRN